MGRRKQDWLIEDWNKEVELPEEVKKVMYDLYTKDQDRTHDIKLNWDLFFDLDISLVTYRKIYYKKAMILLRKDKINKIKKNIDGQSTNR